MNNRTRKEFAHVGYRECSHHSKRCDVQQVMKEFLELTVDNLDEMCNQIANT